MQPSSTEAGEEIAPAVEVRAVTELGLTDLLFNDEVTIAIGTNPAAGTLEGTLTVEAEQGIATFPDLSIEAAASGYTLVASATGYDDATSDAFSITPGPADEETTTITASPTSIPADGASTSTITVQAFDEFGNPLETGGDAVTLSETAGTLGPVTDQGNGTYTATLTAPSTAATATITGTIDGDPIEDEATVEFTPFVAGLEFDQQPTDAEAGATITPAVTVRAVDVTDATLTSFDGNVTIAIGANPAGGTLSGTLTVAANGGVATFSNLSIDAAGSGYTLAASAQGRGATSDPFDVVAGPASGTTTTITASPTSVPADGSSTSTITVRAFDEFGNPLATGGDAVTLSETDGTLGPVTDQGDGTYTAVLTAPSTAATATITGTINGSGIDDDATVEFTVVIAGLEFGQEPTDAAAGAAITPAVTVRAVDGAGATVPSFTGNVTVAIATNPAGGALSGTLTVAAVGGVATFSDLSIDRVGTGYTLSATSPGIAGATSAAFSITPGPASGTTTTITAAPTSVPADGTSTSVILVEARDAQGNRRTTGGDTVVLATTAGTLGPVTDRGDGTYTATLTAPSAAATATISGTINGNSILDTATVTFTAVAPTPSALAFGQQPTTTTAGSSITPAVTVRVVSNTGATVTSFTGNVTVAIGSNPAGGTLSGTTTVAAVSGVATFSNLSVNRAGTGYTLSATSSGLTGATSSAFAITPGPASAATTQITAAPTSVDADGFSSSVIFVEARDAQGNRRTTGGDDVDLSTTAGTLGPVTDRGDGTYTATLTAPTAAATATITGTINGIAITDTATVQFLPVSSTSTRFVFQQQPTNTSAGAAITPAVVVRAVDNSGTTITSFAGSVTISIGSNPAAGSLAGTTTVSAVAGVATFSDLSIDRAGTGYTLTVGATGVTGANSAPFAITPGPASGETTTIDAAPASLIANGSDTAVVTVEVRDAFGNLRTAGGDAVVLATTVGTLGPVDDENDGTYIASLTAPSAPGTATISGTVNGVGIDDTGTVQFNASAPSASTLVFGQQPTNTQAGAPISPPVTLRAVDGSGVLDTSFDGQVTIAMGTNPGGGTLAGTRTVTAVDGVATFAGLSINRVGDGYTLTGISLGIAGATSAPFAITPGPASAATTTITAAPISVPADGSSTSTITVRAIDALGNPRTIGGDAVTLATTAGALGPVTDRGDGTYTATLTAPTGAATATISGTIGGNAIVDTATVTFGSAGSDLAVTVEVDNLEPAVGEAVVYMIRVVNQGPAAAAGVEVTHDLSPRQTFLSAEPSQGSYDPQRGVWTVGSLAPGAEATLAVAVQVTS